MGIKCYQHSHLKTKSPLLRSNNLRQYVLLFSSLLDGSEGSSFIRDISQEQLPTRRATKPVHFFKKSPQGRWDTIFKIKNFTDVNPSKT